MDVLSEVLQQMRLTGAVLFRGELSAPWCIAARPESAMAAQLASPTMHLISFHVVLEGHLWARFASADLRHVQQGEVLIVPHGHAHILGDAPSGDPVSAAELFGDTPLSQLSSFTWGGGGAVTRVMCGYLACERNAFSPLFAALPPLFKVRLSGNGAAHSLEPLLAYAEHEILAPRPGAEGLRLRMAELMFVEALRRYMESLPEAESGWLAGLRDPIVGRALMRLHEAPQRCWTVDELARAVAASRSHLAERFKQVLGEPPMQYLARWRMLLAARRLRDSRDSVATVGEAVGYESSAAFQRSFKRYMRTTPARWRRDAGSAKGGMGLQVDRQAGSVRRTLAVKALGSE